MENFVKKTAIVTGGASGIGKELCLALGAQAANVVVADIDSEGAEAVAETIRSCGGQAAAVKVDVSRKEDIRKVIEKAKTDYGRLDYMFNNAGINIFGEFKDMPYDEWKRILDINLWGAIHGTTQAYQLMVQQGFGHIVNTASLSGIFPSVFEVAYTTTKHGIVGLSTSLREEAKAYNVNISVVCPSFVRTPIFENTKLLKVDREIITSSPAFKNAPSPKRAVEQILKGVVNNKAVIPVNRDANILWRLYRYAPAIALLAGKLKLKIGRKMVAESTKTLKNASNDSTTETQPMNHSENASEEEIKRLSHEALLQMFLELESPDLEEMNGEYRANLLAQRSVSAEISAFFTAKNPLIPWLCKAFRPVDGEKGRGYNTFRCFGKVVQHYPMETFIAPSRYDGKPAYHLVYRAFHSGCGTIHMVDEVRRITAGLYLGIGTFGQNEAQRRIPHPFLLKGPIADYRGDIGRVRQDYRPEQEVPALAGSVLAN